MTTFLTDHAEIQAWLDRHAEYEKASISDTGIVKVEGAIVVSKVTTTQLPVQFGTVTGSFQIQSDTLLTLHGVPSLVGGNFDCRKCNALKDLTGSPDFVHGAFIADDCAELATAKGISKQILSFITLENCPKLVDVRHITSPRHLYIVESPNVLLDTTHFPIADTIYIDPSRELTADMVRIGIQRRVQILYIDYNCGCEVLTDFLDTGDLLTAVARFEEVYHEPFHLPGAVHTTSDIPSL